MCKSKVIILKELAENSIFRA